MFKWFKKKEAPREICIPKIFLDNNIEFSYQHSLEISTIPIRSNRTIKDVKTLVWQSDEKGLKDLSTRDLDTDSAKVYILIGSNEQERMLIAILDPINSDKEPRLISYKILNEVKKKLELAS